MSALADAAAEDLQRDCLTDAIEQAVCALLDVVVMRKAWGAETGLDTALRAALRELGIVLHGLGGVEAMEAVAHEASIDAPPNNALRSNYLHHCWRGIGDQRGRWAR